MKFARFEVDRAPGPDTVTMRARLRGAEGFAKPVELLVLSSSAPREALDRFLQGGARLAELADGNLIQVLEVGYEDDRAFLATEASPGLSLAKLLEQCRARGLDSMPLAIAFGIGADLAKALAHAHAHTDVENQPDPVTHGALRSEAVTVGEDGAVKLGGFVPWRSAPSSADDVEKLVELVGQWVSEADRKLVRESASGVTSAAQLRKAWAAFAALHFPQTAPDARRALLGFSRGDVPLPALVAKLGAPKERASVPRWAFAVAGGAVALLAAALLWPSDPVPAAVIAPAPVRVRPPVVERFHAEVHVQGDKHHLELSPTLPALSPKDGDVWFGEAEAPPAEAPQLLVKADLRDGTTRFSTVPLRYFKVPGATKLTLFSWVPFDARFRSPGMRSVVLFGTPRLIPLVEEWMEVAGEGARLRLPPHKQVVLSLKGAPAGSVVLVAISYGVNPVEYESATDRQTRWPYQLTRLVLTPDRPSATIDDAQELALVSPGAEPDLVVSVDEGGGIPAHQQWPDWRPDTLHTLGAVAGQDLGVESLGPNVKARVEGHVPGLENPAAFEEMSQCFSNPHQTTIRSPLECFGECVRRFPDAYECWHQLALLKQKGAAEKFYRLAQDKVGHPYLNHAETLAKPER